MFASPAPCGFRGASGLSRQARRRLRRDGVWGRFSPLAVLRVPLVILGFIAWWPIGLGLLSLFLALDAAARSGAAPWIDHLRDRALPLAGSGNTAFDAHRAAVLARLEEERRQLDAQQAEFQAFIQQLRRAEDREEFDRFMAARDARG
jgi:hypothetical protein